MKPKNETLKNAILATTTNLIMTQGIDGTSTVKVAKQLKISQSNIYSYFKNKQTLLIAVFEQQQHLITDYLATALNPKTEPREQIDQLLTAMIEFGLKNPQPFQIILSFRQHLKLRSTLPTIAENPVFSQIFALMAKYQQAGIIKDYPVHFLAEGAFSLIINYLISRYSKEVTAETLTPAQVVTLVDSMLLVQP